MSVRKPFCGRHFRQNSWAGSTASPSFRPLAAEDLARIAALQLRELAVRLKRQNVALERPGTAEHLGALCANEPGRARSLRRRLQTEIEGPGGRTAAARSIRPTLRAVWRQGSVVVEAPERCFKTYVQKFDFRGFFTKRRRISKNFFQKRVAIYVNRTYYIIEVEQSG